MGRLIIEYLPCQDAATSADPVPDTVREFRFGGPEGHLHIADRKVRVSARLLAAEHNVPVICNSHADFVSTTWVLLSRILEAQRQVRYNEACMLDEQSCSVPDARDIRHVPSVVRPQTRNTGLALDRSPDSLPCLCEISLQASNEESVGLDAASLPAERYLGSQ